ncbi:MAG: rhomboid family intramembrane serine protease [Rhodobacteraceae bacterium]|nr:rhomboid family intramembrane serine protease [Paracoccaceae bacterium]
MFPIRDHNPSERTPYVTYALIAINIVVYLGGLVVIQNDRALAELYYAYAMIPARISEGENLISLVTSTFLHGGFMHLAGNMLFLWIFGDNLEEEMGHVGFLAFYLAAGIAAGLMQWIADPYSSVPMVGASGAIAGVMGGYLLLFPKAKVDVLIFLVIFVRIFPLPAWIVLGLWFGIQILSSFGADAAQGGVAYWAHIGGFIAGFVLTAPVWMRHGARGYWQKTDGHPPHPEAKYPFSNSNIPRVNRRK